MAKKIVDICHILFSIEIELSKRKYFGIYLF